MLTSKFESQKSVNKVVPQHLDSAFFILHHRILISFDLLKK